MILLYFKIKTNAEITIDKQYVKLNVEKYGGSIGAPWLDRPLSAAGRIVFRTQVGETVLDRPLSAAGRIVFRTQVGETV